jgi:putative peptidoglycan lipid II flippase
MTPEKRSTRWQKWTSGSINRQIFGAAVLVGGLTVLVKIVTVSKELLVAWQFGTGEVLDAFFMALVVPAFLINTIAGSFNAALVPTYIQVLEREGKHAAQQLFANAMVLGLGLLGVLAIAIGGTAPIYLPWLASGFDDRTLHLTLQLLWTIAPFVVLGGVGAIWSAALNARERFAAAALIPTVTPILTVILLLCVPSWGVFALAVGLVGGACLELVCLGVALDRQGGFVRPSWQGWNEPLRQIAAQYSPIVAGSLLMCSTGLVDQSMTAMLSPGSVAALNYGNRVIALPLTLAVTALNTAVIPYVSKMSARQDWQGMRHLLNRYLKLIFAASIPLTLTLILASEPIVKLLFERGSFTAGDTRLVAQIQICYALQIPFYVAAVFIVKLINAMKVNQVLMWGSALNLLVNILGNYLFMNYWGVRGIALSTSCVLCVSFFYLFFFVNRQIHRLSHECDRSSTPCR